MKRFILFAVAAVIFVSASAVQAQQSPAAQAISGKTQPPTPNYIAVNRQAAVSCNYCFTCGGDWGVLSGWAQTGQNFQVFERGSGCSGALTVRTDSTPFLCCN
jgi:hypothetical protein